METFISSSIQADLYKSSRSKLSIADSIYNKLLKNKLSVKLTVKIIDDLPFLDFTRLDTVDKEKLISWEV